MEHLHVNGCRDCALSSLASTRDDSGHTTYFWRCHRLPGTFPGQKPWSAPASCPLRAGPILISLNETPND